MHELSFTASEPLTVGIEEEFLLLDPQPGSHAVAFVADQLLDGAQQTVAVPGGWLKPELLRCSVEATTAASTDLLQVDVDLRALRDEVVRRARAANCRVVATGMHPHLAVDLGMLLDEEERQAMGALYERVGDLRDQSTHGIHVHVGMPGLAEAVDVTDALAGFVPMLVACTANSPVRAGRRAPFLSARAAILARTIWAGPTPHLADEREYRLVHALHQSGNDGEQRFKWDASPVPALGTVELRIIDASPDPDVALGVAAFCQSLAARVLDVGRPPRANESLERHNRWSAMEFGDRARFLVPGRDAPVEVRELMLAAVESVLPYAQQLGCDSWLRVFDELVEGAPAVRAVAAFERGGIGGMLEDCALEPVPSAGSAQDD